MEGEYIEGGDILANFAGRTGVGAGALAGTEALGVLPTGS